MHISLKTKEACMHIENFGTSGGETARSPVDSTTTDGPHQTKGHKNKQVVQKKKNALINSYYYSSSSAILYLEVIWYLEYLYIFWNFVVLPPPPLPATRNSHSTAVTKCFHSSNTYFHYTHDYYRRQLAPWAVVIGTEADVRNKYILNTPTLTRHI